MKQERSGRDALTDGCEGSASPLVAAPGGGEGGVSRWNRKAERGEFAGLLGEQEAVELPEMPTVGEMLVALHSVGIEWDIVNDPAAPCWTACTEPMGQEPADSLEEALRRLLRAAEHDGRSSSPVAAPGAIETATDASSKVTEEEDSARLDELEALVREADTKGIALFQGCIFAIVRQETKARSRETVLAEGGDIREVLDELRAARESSSSQPSVKAAVKTSDSGEPPRTTTDAPTFNVKEAVDLLTEIADDHEFAAERARDEGFALAQDIEQRFGEVETLRAIASALSQHESDKNWLRAQRDVAEEKLAKLSPSETPRQRFTTDPSPWTVRVEGPGVLRHADAPTLQEAAELAGIFGAAREVTDAERQRIDAAMSWMGIGPSTRAKVFALFAWKGRMPPGASSENATGYGRPCITTPGIAGGVHYRRGPETDLCTCGAKTFAPREPVSAPTGRASPNDKENP